MGLADIASLVTASADLQVVSLVIGAIRAADASVGSFAGGINGEAGFGPAATFEARRHLTPQPTYLPRQVFHPTPLYLPRPILHPTPRIELSQIPVAADPEQPPRAKSFCIQPPWKVMPWETPVPPKPVIKIICYQPDIPNKGDLLDIFL